MYSAFTAPLLDGESYIAYNNSNLAIVVGNVKWETNDSPIANKPTLDMRNALIEIGIKEWNGFNAIASDYTDESGHYEIIINPEDIPTNKDLYLRIALKGKTFEVSTFWNFPHYYYEYNLSQMVSSGKTVTYNALIKCDKSEDVYKATYVHQGMVIAERFAEEMGFESDKYIWVAYPAESVSIEIDGVEYSLSNMAFCYGYLGYDSIAAIGINSYDKPKIIVHEYSHYIQCSMGNFGEDMPEILFLSTHDGTSDYYEQKGDKSFAMHLSWTEGWGYAFSVMAQRYYVNEYMPLWKSNTYETTISTTNDDSYLGEFQEKSTKAFLWSLIDTNMINCDINTNGAVLDYQLPWTPQEWWNMTTVTGTCRLPDFIKLIENESYNLGTVIDYKHIKGYIADKLTIFNIAPEITSTSARHATAVTSAWH